MKLRAYQPKKGRIEIIPMIDTIFFLLVFFMMASLAMTTSRGIPVNLPRSATATERPAVQVVLTVTETGQHYVDKTPVDPRDIYDSLKKCLKDNPSAHAVINCDKSQPWERGIWLVDEAKRAGFKFLDIATEPRQVT